MAEWLTYLLIGLFIAGWLACWYWGVVPRLLDLPGLANQEGRDGAQPGTARQAGEPECWWCNHLPYLFVGWHLRWVADRMTDDEPPETWVEDLPPERALHLVPAAVYVALSDDPDLVVWDARQQWQRCWEIVHVDFPRLRAELGIAA